MVRSMVMTFLALVLFLAPALAYAEQPPSDAEVAAAAYDFFDENLRAALTSSLENERMDGASMASCMEQALNEFMKRSVAVHHTGMDVIGNQPLMNQDSCVVD